MKVENANSFGLKLILMHINSMRVAKNRHMLFLWDELRSDELLMNIACCAGTRPRSLTIQLMPRCLHTSGSAGLLDQRHINCSCSPVPDA